jgi:ABC-type transport system involved in multi-copper enzyme maturation permease subunit
MKQFRAILVDSLHESADRKSLLVLLILSALLVLFVGGISFQTDGPESVLEEQATKIGLFSRGGGIFNWFAVRVDLKVGDIKLVTTDEGWRPDLNGGHAVTLTFKDEKELDGFVRSARANEERLASRREGRPYVEPPANVPVTPQNRLRCLEVRFERVGYGHVQARLLQADPPTFRVAVRTDYPHELGGASHMTMFYGGLVVPLPPQISVAEMVVHIQLMMANVFGGFIGVLVAIMTCSGFVPSMLQKGTLDLVLARPVGRGRLLLYKYVGGLWFVFILATVVVGGCWLAITLRTGYANPWFLATILTIVASFAAIYAVSVLVGVLTRSGTVAALVAIFVWGTSETLIAIRTNLKRAFVGQMVPQWLQSTLDVMYGFAPKTGDLMSLNTHFLSRSHLSETAYQRAFAGQIPKVDWLWSMGTTAAFTAAMLLLAIWFFRRRDY